MTLDVADYSEYEHKVLFCPVRSLSGQVVMIDKMPLPRVVIEMDGKKHQIDRNGYFWIKNIGYGEHEIKMLNIPKNICSRMDDGNGFTINAPKEGYAGRVTIKLKKCQSQLGDPR